MHGNYKLLQKTKAKIGNALIVMEDNKEEYLGYSDLFLSIFGLGREENVSLTYL